MSVADHEDARALLGGARRVRTRVRGFAPWAPRGTTLGLLEQVRGVLGKYEDYLPLTIRQIFYRLVGAQNYEKTEQTYARLCEYLNRARRARIIPMASIRDDGGVISAPDSWDSVEQFIVEHVQGRPLAIHATYLRPDGSGKADIPKEQQKASFGPIKGGAVRLGILRAGEWLAVGEGIETTLSVAAACAMPRWAALAAGGICSLVLSREATHVIICADHDASGVGERAAREAAARWLAEGRRVKLALPPRAGIDFNDILRGVASAPTGEARRVAD